MRIVASLLHYRSWPEVSSTIDAVLAQTRRPDAFVVVDNASGDGSADRIAAAYPDVELVRVETNRGPIGGMNIALESALERSAEAVLLVTDDCRLAPDAVALLASRLEEDPAVGAAGPLLADANRPERIFSAGGRIDPRSWDTVAIDDPPEVDRWTSRPPFVVDWHNSSALLLRAEAARRAGYYHEPLRYFFDEPDYLLRLPPMGWRVECVPAAVAWHEMGEPTPGARMRARLLFLSRRAPRRVLVRELVRVPYLAARMMVSPAHPGARRAGIERCGAVASFVVEGVISYLRSRSAAVRAALR